MMKNFKMVLKAVNDYQLIDDFVPFSVHDILVAIKKLKINSSPGSDQIHNLLLKNLPYQFICKLFYSLVNRSIQSGMPVVWKLAKIIMIPKIDGMSSDPNEYKPISLTSSIEKLIERLIKFRLYSYLESNEIIVNQQSGFRNRKGAANNLIFFT